MTINDIVRVNIKWPSIVSVVVADRIHRQPGGNALLPLLDMVIAHKMRNVPVPAFLFGITRLPSPLTAPSHMQYFDDGYPEII